MLIAKGYFDQMNVAEAIESRASVRQYKNQAVPRQDLEEILRLASYAPSAWNLQPWRFYAVQDTGVKTRLVEAAFHQGQVASAPVVIAVVADGPRMLSELDGVARPEVSADPEKLAGFKAMLEKNFGSKTAEEQSRWGAGQAYIAIGYLSLAARSLGYDTSIMLGFNPAAVKDILALPSHTEIPALVALGKADAAGSVRQRHDLTNLVTII